MSFFRELGKLLMQEKEHGPGNPSKTMEIHNVDSDDKLQEAFNLSETSPVVLFKHSLTCPVSTMMRRRVLHLTEENDPSVYEIIVQTARPLSQKLEQMLGIRHESPQVIVIHRQTAIYNASHGGISTDAIRAAVAQASLA